MKGIETLKAFIASHYEPNAYEKLEQERINQIEVIEFEEL